MLKLIAVGFWVCLVCVASMLGGLWLFADTGRPRVAEEKGEVFKIDSMSVPVIRDSQVTGYVIAELAFLVDPDKAKLLPMPVDLLISGETYAYFFDRHGQDNLKRNSAKLGQAMEDLRSVINSRYSVAAVKAIEVKQLDFLSKEEIRDMQVRRAVE